MSRGYIFIISGPSGVGKSTIIKKLLAQNTNFTQIPSYTTRPPRPEDTLDQSRLHLTKEEFLKMANAAELVDWVDYADNLYGKSKKLIQQALDEGKIVLVDTDHRGVKPYKQAFPNLKTIFILYDTNDIKNRLRERRPSCTDQEIDARYQAILADLSHKEEYDYQVINIEGKPEIATAQVEKIIQEPIS